MAEEENFWWRRGIFQKPRAVVRWDHTEEGKVSRGIAEEGRKVTWSELFFDLVFVTLIAKLGEAFQEGHLTLLQVIVMFRVLYDNWLVSTIYSCRFFTDDVPSKLFVGAQMFLLILAGLKLNEPFAESARNFLFFGGVFQLFTALPYLRVFFHLKEYRAFVVHDGIFPGLVKGACYIAISRGSVEWLVPGMLIVLVGMLSFMFCSYFFTCLRFKKANRVPMHLDHLVERRGCLRLIVFGEVVSGCTVDPQSVDWMSVSLILLGYLLVFNMKLLAFDVDVVHLDRHAMRHGGAIRAFSSIESSILFDGAMAALGSSVKIVLSELLRKGADDGHKEAGESAYVFSEIAHILLCGSVAVGIAALTIERLSHVQDYELQAKKEVDVLHVQEGMSLLHEEDEEHVHHGKHGYGAIEDEKCHYIEATHPDGANEYDVALAKAIFKLQIAVHVIVVLLVTGLAVYCLSIDEDYEFLLVLTALWVLTSMTIAVDLLDEALLF